MSDMLPDVAIGEVGSLLSGVIALAMAGVILSGSGYVSFQLHRRLSERMNVDEPDPTYYFRYWRQLFDRVFHPVGEQVVVNDREAVANRALYELVVGVAVTGVYLGVYILTSGLILSGMVISYYSMGVVPDLSTVIDSVAAFCLLVGIVTIVYASERSGEVVRN